jgi:NAD(P)-dependent dehydrogenase (short-subunit alcohol dehydrogenase family)
MSAGSGVGSMTGRVCVVTGATSGIGFVTARELARLGASVVAVGRDPNRLSDAVTKITSAAPSASVRGLVADLFLEAEVRRLASEIGGLYPRVHVLVNDAGAMFSRRGVTAEGVEQTWALNVVTPFLLTHLLLPRLVASAPARVVNVASAAHRGVTLDFENLQGEKRWAGFRAYSRSKLAVVLLTHEFARRLDGARVTVNTLHPGFVASRFGRNNPGGVGAAIGVFAFLFGISPERGARTVVFLSSDPSVENVSGKYFVRRREVASSPASYDMAAAARLWDVLALQTGIPTDILSRKV